MSLPLYRTIRSRLNARLEAISLIANIVTRDFDQINERGSMLRINNVNPRLLTCIVAKSQCRQMVTSEPRQSLLVAALQGKEEMITLGS
jgi:hypothetical protein